MAGIKITAEMIAAGRAAGGPYGGLPEIYRAMFRAGPYIRIDPDMARAEFLARGAESTAAIRAEGVVRFHIRQCLLIASGWLARLALALGRGVATDG